jgi:hypothetical protein
MAPKKADGSRPARPRLPLASRLLSSAVHATPAVTPPDEPWRNRQPRRRNRGKRQK